MGITSFLFRQGLACLSLLSVESTGINHHAWFTHMILEKQWRLLSACYEGTAPAPSVLSTNMLAACPLDWPALACSSAGA